MPLDIVKLQELASKAHPRPWEFAASDASLIDLGTKDDVYEHHVLSACRCESCQKSDVEKFPCLWPTKDQADFLLFAVNNIEAAAKEIRDLRAKIAVAEETKALFFDQREDGL